MDAETFTVDTQALLTRLYNYYDNLKPDKVVLDVETDSPIEKTANLYGIGLCFNEAKAFYIPWRTPEGEFIWDETYRSQIAQWIKEISGEAKLIGHNISFDALVMENTIDISVVDDIYADTILMKHTLSEEPPFALKELAVLELGDWADKAQDTLKDHVILAGGKWTKAQKDMYLAPTEVLAEYCCWDVLLTLKLYNIYQARLEAENLTDLFYKDEVMDLYREVTIPMKRHGIRINLPHFEALKDNIEKDILTLEDNLHASIEADVEQFVQKILDTEIPVKNKGSFPKALADVLHIPLPITKSGKVTLSAKAVEKQLEANSMSGNFYRWLLGQNELKILPKGKMTKAIYDFPCDKAAIRMAQEVIYFGKKQNAGKRHVFNLGSNDHLAHLLFKVYKLPIDPKAKTDSGKPQVNESVISSFAGSVPFVDNLLMLKKLNKLNGTYIQGILDRQIGGRIYASLLQFGTTSGRYASRNPNLQNLPRVPGKALSIVEKYTAAIRKGFIADEGCSLIDADYSALEPRCFSHVSGDKKLQELWDKGEDMYSRIAIDVFDLDNISAHPDDANFLKKVDPEYRQDSKVFSLAVPYGAEAGRIAQARKCSFQEAHDLITKYLNAYPGLKQYMATKNHEAKLNGFVKTEFGRVRHLPQAKSIYALYGNDILDFKWAKKRGLLDIRRKFKNALNNAKNFPIQGLAAHIVNRGMIQIAKKLRELGTTAYICLTVHDQVIVNTPFDDVVKVKKIVQDCLEQCVKLTVPLIAEPEVAGNLADSH